MKIGILITARLKSERLPRKVLKPLNGRPMLEYLVDRLRRSQFGQNMVICTSTVSQDDALEEFALRQGVQCYRGHPDDVLSRNLAAAEQFGYDLVLSCTADNPFVDEVWMDKLAAAMVAGGYDFGTQKGLPFGSHSYSFTRAAAETACHMKDEIDTEVWGGYFTQTGRFKCLTLNVDDPAHLAPRYRLTVDESADFSLAQEILSAVGGPFPPSLPDVIRFLDANPDLACTNADVQQKPGKPIRLKK